MSIFDFNCQMSAKSLYAGGWRSCDRYELQREYELTDEETDGICDVLESLEIAENEERWGNLHA